MISFFPSAVARTETNKPAALEQEYKHGDVTIIVHQQNDKEHSDLCNGMVRVNGPGKVEVYTRLFSKMEAVGDTAGLYIPEMQPLREYFLVVKLGDYDGRLLLIGRKGGVLDLIGGAYVLAKNGRYLMSDYHADLSGLAVFDTQQGKVVFNASNLPHFYSWYRAEGRFFFTESDRGYEKSSVIYEYDFNAHRIVKLQSGKGGRVLKELSFDFNPRKKGQCGGK